MKAAVLYGPADIRVEQVPVPEISDEDVLVRVKMTGICGSDLPRVLGHAAHFYPIILGHEFAGVVEQVGSSVKGLKIGDRVAGAPLRPCFRCADCAQAQYAQCKHYSFIGSREAGSFAEFVKLPAMNAIVLQDTVSFAEGALFEPSAVALHALRHIGYQGGAHVAILGVGNIGLLTLQWAKVLGGREVTVFDIDDERLETARKLGADHALNTASEGFLEQARELTGGRGYGVVMETAGSTMTMNLSFELAGNHAKVCFVGTPHQDLSFRPELFEKMNRMEFTLTGSWMSYSAPFPGVEWEMSQAFLAQGKLDLNEMVHMRRPLDDISDVFEQYKTPGKIKGKVLLEC